MLDLQEWVRGIHNVYIRSFLVALGLLALSACGSGDEVQPLRVGMIPDAGATQVSVESKAPLRQYLSDQLGRPVELIIPTNYNATVEAIGNGSLDIAYFGGLTYVKAHQLYGAVPLVQRQIDQQFHTLFITGKGTGITSLADLKGKSFCFGDINSTSGHLIPRMVLKSAGIAADSDLAEIRHTGSHPATAEAVASGVCDAGALDETVYNALVDEGKIDRQAVTVFLTSEPFADYVWAARQGLDPQDEQAFSNALLALKPGRDDRVLDILRAEKFLPANNASYADVARIAKELGLL